MACLEWMSCRMDNEYAKAFARAFAAEKLLEKYFQEERERPIGPEVTDSVMRHWNGRRSMANDIIVSVNKVKNGRT